MPKRSTRTSRQRPPVDPLEPAIFEPTLTIGQYSKRVAECARAAHQLLAWARRNPSQNRDRESHISPQQAVYALLGAGGHWDDNGFADVWSHLGLYESAFANSRKGSSAPRVYGISGTSFHAVGAQLAHRVLEAVARCAGSELLIPRGGSECARIPGWELLCWERVGHRQQPSIEVVGLPSVATNQLLRLRDELAAIPLDDLAHLTANLEQERVWVEGAEAEKEARAVAREARESLGNAHSIDYRSALWNGVEYEFTEMQAACVKVLWEAWKHRTPTVSEQTILEEAESSGCRLRDIFKDHAAWGTMIVSANKKGGYRFSKPPEK